MSKSAWKIAGEIVVMLGGLACILTWLGITPKDLRVTPTTSHVAWLIVGLLLFAISLTSSLRAGFLHPRTIKGLRDALSRERELVKQSKDALAESANRNLEYRTRLAELTELLTPLQLEAIAFRAKIQAFIASLDPEPQCDTSDCQNDPEKNVAVVSEFKRRHTEFSQKLLAKYLLVLREEALALSRKFVAGGIPPDQKIAELGGIPDHFHPVEWLQRISMTIWEKAGLLQ